MRYMRRRDAHKQLARTSLNGHSFGYIYLYFYMFEIFQSENSWNNKFTLFLYLVLFYKVKPKWHTLFWDISMYLSIYFIKKITYPKGALTVNYLCTYVYIYIWQLSSFRAPTLWFIDLTVATCHIQYTFLSLCQFVSRENGQNRKILEIRHFRMIRAF